MPSTSSTRMSCQGRQLRLRDRREPRSERSLMGTWNLHATSHLWDITFTFLPRPAAQENGVLKFPDLREEDAVLDSGAECAHTNDAVCGSLWAASRSARDILHYETVDNYCYKHNEYGGKFFSPKLDNIQECLANLSSFPANYQLPSMKKWCL